MRSRGGSRRPCLLILRRKGGILNDSRHENPGRIPEAEPFPL